MMAMVRSTAAVNSDHLASSGPSASATVWLRIIRFFETIHDWIYPALYMRALRVICKRTRMATALLNDSKRDRNVG